MKSVFSLLIFYIITIYASSLEDALEIGNCLKACRNESCRNICNRKTTGLDIETELNISANASPVLHCKNSRAIMFEHNPGIFIVEQSISESQWAKPRMTAGRFTIFSNLTSDQNYRYKFRRVLKNGFSQSELSNWFRTYKSDYMPKPISKDKIYLQQVKKDEDNFQQLKALIKFEPSDRVCNYDILFWAREHNLISFSLIQPESFEINLKNLNYNENHTVFITSVNNHGTMSEKTPFSFITPTCLGLNFNFSYCAPNKVGGLVVKENYKENNLYDVLVHWSQPELLPDNFTIQIVPFYLQNEPYYLTVPGNVTEALFPMIELKINYQVSIIAESGGGTSPKTIIFKNIIENEALNTPSYNLIIAFLILIVIIITAATIYLLQSKRNDKNIQYTHLQGFGQKNLVDEIKKKMQVEDYQKSSGKELDKIPSDKFELNPNQLEMKNILGSGAYGIVRLGLLKIKCGKTIQVAVKTLNDDPTIEDIKSLHHEISIMKSAGKHRNIVSLIGCYTSSRRPLLVVEFCSKGDLQTYLKKIWEEVINVLVDHEENLQLSEKNMAKLANNSSETSSSVNNKLYDLQEDIKHSTENITAADLLNFARQVATGMEFLSSNKIVHRDLAARNVLVCVDRVVKISDFGLSRDIYQENVYRKRSNGKLPIKWMAIEALTHQVYTTHSDVWSFGILLWEIITMGGSPYPGIPANGLLKFLQSGYRMERPLNCGIELYNLMLSCWDARPHNRPSFTMIKHSLDELLGCHSKNKYLNLNEVLQEPRDYYQLMITK
ncbi:tyrosine-protein kinase receptor torso-like isoform X2 [Prorops nasuta]|uniref:tyrosine-protein kinase receptor torso-like isoform X2 n=1 Tax=Prorops nasuta TaxID=863751 RepID=UPI0034CD5F7D